MTAQKTDYDIHTELVFEPLTLIDVPARVAACEHPWHNETLARVNDAVVRLGILKGEFHWHHHDVEDEFFFVVDGRLTVELEGRSVDLGPKQGLTVPRGVRHRTLSPEGCVVLMVEGAGVVPTGD